MTDWITPDEAVAYLPRFNADWYRIALRKGTLEGSKVNGRWFTTRAFIDEMVTRGSNNQRRRKGRAA